MGGVLSPFKRALLFQGWDSSRPEVMGENVEQGTPNIPDEEHDEE